MSFVSRGIVVTRPREQSLRLSRFAQAYIHATECHTHRRHTKSHSQGETARTHEKTHIGETENEEQWAP